MSSVLLPISKLALWNNKKSLIDIRRSMSHFINITKKDNYLLVSHEGIVTPQSLKGVISNTIQAIVYHNCYKVVIDYQNSILHASCLDMIEVHGQYLAEAQALGLEFFTIKRAYILGNHVRTKEQLRFLETYSQNRGHSVRIFATEDEAVSWLRTFQTRRPIVSEPVIKKHVNNVLSPIKYLEAPLLINDR